MRKFKHITFILGSPASGKTTLARRLAADLGLDCLCKDDIKEALFDVLGPADRERSALLSEASFAALTRLAHTQLAVGRSCILEGNWRASHAEGLAAVLAGHGARAAQICCCAESVEIARRFASRKRHPGHLDELLSRTELHRAVPESPAFMDLDGPRWVYRSDASETYADLHQALNNWLL
ncbi:MAG: AAA family ATPase [Steroidobacteraceae bacterium]